MFSNYFFSFENRAVCEIMCKNIVELNGPQLTVWHVRVACWIPKATNTLSGYVIPIVFFSCKNGCINASQCYVIRTLPVLLTVVVDCIEMCTFVLFQSCVSM